MRHLSVTFPYREQGRGTVYESLVPHAPGRRAALYNLNLLDDGTTIELVRIEGVIDDILGEIEQRENLIDFELVQSADDIHYIYQRIDQDSLLVDLLNLLRAERILIDFPITYGEHGVTVRVIGPDESIQRLFEELPGDVRDELEVESIAEYDPESTIPRDRLSTRQLEVLEAAVNIGYYTFPRDATIDDLANRLGISTSTASEHLRRIEARVLGALA